MAFIISTVGKVTLASIVILTIVVTILESFVVYYHVSFVSQFILSSQGDGISQADLVYHAIFILSLGFQIVLCADALWRRNTIQLLALVVYNILALGYAAIQLYQHKILEDEGTDSSVWNPPDPSRFPGGRIEAKEYFQGKMRPLEYIIIGIVSAFSVYLALLVRKLTQEFGWENYRTYSADLQIRKAYVSLTILQTLLKMDIFFIGSYAIQLIPSEKIGYSQSIVETVLIFVVGTLMLTMAWYAVSREKKYVLLSVINLLSLSLIYIVYRLVKVNLRQQPDPYQFTRHFLTFFLTTTFLLVGATIVEGIICFKNMMHGTYVFTVFRTVDKPLDSVNYSGLEGSDASNVPVSTKRQSKRASAIALQQQNQKPRLTLD